MINAKNPNRFTIHRYIFLKAPKTLTIHTHTHAEYIRICIILGAEILALLGKVTEIALKKLRHGRCLSHTDTRMTEIYPILYIIFCNIPYKDQKDTQLKI